MLLRVCGLVFAGVFWGFYCGWVFVGVFSWFSLLFSIFVSFCILPVCSGVLTLFIKFLCLLIKK
jgi:hypothetical protein